MMVLALLIGPSYKLFPKLPGGAAMRDARRLFGVSGAWFAMLHAILAYISQARGSGAAPQTLLINTPMLLGIASLVILLALAFTSFDRAFKGMGIWWFRLHRLIYTAGFVALIHAFMVGAHASDIGPLMVLCSAVLLLLILHTCVILQRPKISEWHIAGLVIAFILLIIIGNYGVQRYVQRTILLTEHSHQ
jgi:DMSO/TMAO reductase YedYZ heme-binding membrane subunit